MKKIAVDIGNSNIVIGVFDNQWKHIWRLPTHKHPNKFDYALKINNLLFEYDICPEEIEYIIISSVVPELTSMIQKFFHLYSKNTYLFTYQFYDLLEKIKIDNPMEIGTDLVANAYAGFQIFKQPVIIVDFGTALTFTVVDEKGSILGVNIVPGIKTAIQTLSEKTSQLDKVSIKFPKHKLGKNTEEAIQNGILLGYEGLVKYMIEQIENQYQKKFKVLLTGGLSHLYEKRLDYDKIDKNLTLEGLIKIGKIIHLKNNR